ncbi:ABC transporter substrate-binding protein [Thalassospira alkalitolerans]|uniref:Sugar ABC transporter substrate-binding protein n=1 Tax=Thalassospira alkalitolerans TaxID=1293890 RepID=A0A1Y2LEC5_9PROT|nr:extracellular solute-binding protein [Thalassospira alkalitolerans]OSQ49429.1 sugar ABC transporter substrate-binding protein [Thalassospira alkalitolerans]|tara:strand:+ start:32514 stop:33923 length:1410 start_codon:yes stop_codon:yes gene_type:complete
MIKRLLATTLVSLVIAQPAMADFWSDAAADLKGETIRGVSESTPPSNYVRDVLAPAFTEATGIKVEFETTSWDQMYDKAIKDMEANSGIYDFVYIEQDIIYSYLARDFLVDLSEALANKPELKSADFSFDDFTTFIDNFRNENGDVFGVPMEAFIKVYLYRKDLFENPKEQAAFKEKYGYDLAPAKNFEQYRDIAEFFTRPGDQLWGTTVQAASGHPASFYEFFESIAPTYGVYNWGINLDAGAASVENGGQMNSELAKQALAYWVSLLDFAPPEATASTWDEVASTFAAGRAAQGWVYGENAAWIATNPEKSTVVGKVGVTLPPMNDGVMADAEAGKGYIGYYDGGAFGIPYSSKRKDAALLWLEYIGQPSVQADWALAGSRVVHQATYDDPKVLAQDAKADGYFTLMKEKGYLFKGAPEYPFHAQVREAVAPFIYEAIIGQLSADEALDKAAAAADAELKQLGYSKK